MMELNELKKDCASKQKKGIHFILASVIIWVLVTIIHLTKLPPLTKNLLTFCATAPMLPIAFLISKIIGIDFADKTNPLNQLGLIFSVNQIIYLLIAMWVYSASPDKLLMVIVIIFGGHLLPYGWLYESKAYMFMSVFISLLAVIVGLLLRPLILALTMVVIEVVFSGLLWIEVRKLDKMLYEEVKVN